MLDSGVLEVVGFSWIGIECVGAGNKCVDNRRERSMLTWHRLCLESSSVRSS
jgi:hypothetical protein